MIYMYWFRNGNENNFGDELGPFLVAKLSGSPISYIPIIDRPWRIPFLYLRGLTKGDYSISNFTATIRGVFRKDVLITIGSIISFYGGATPTIWGSGLLTRKGRIEKANFLAVRGKYTQARIKELGYKAPEVLGDPALLLPLVLPNTGQKKYKLAVIPHYIHFKKTLELFKDEDVLVIDLLSDIKDVVIKLNQCERAISSSLHGVIVSHAYGIPCLWYDLSDKKLAGDNVKFKDYFSSVNIREYSPFKLMGGDSVYIDRIIEEIDSNSAINKINRDLSSIHRELLSVAPFPLLPKYKALLDTININV